MRKKLVAVGTAIGVAALSLMSAVPAQAANETFDCGSGTAPPPGPIVFLNVGDTYTISNSSSNDNCTNVRTTGDAGVLSWTDGTTAGTTTLAGSATLTVTAVAAGLATLRLDSTGSPTAFFAIQFSVLSGGGGGSTSTGSSSGPAPTVQQFGKPDSTTCDEAQPEGLNWSGVPSGGWGESWAQWMNGGNGGTVCTRTLSYVGSGWTVN